MSAQQTNFRILVVAPASRRDEFSRQLEALRSDVLFVTRSAEAATVVREGDLFQVALLPATLSDTDWWELWGVLALMNPRPALLVYAREASFQLWSGVLDLGGHDVIVEPFSDEELQDAVLRAAKSFEQQPPNGTDS